MAAGTRVLEARATLGVAIGELYPQTQQLGGNVGYNQASTVDPTSNPLHELENYWRASLGTQVAGAAQTALGTLQPGEVVSLPVQTITGVYATCAEESIVRCVISRGGNS